ncbi:MAG: malate dehydrogenase [Coriobacteriia bacterium]|nr:malate dehydrogenase [Coriobacteriia bacterium]
MPLPKVTVVGAGQVGATAAFLTLTKGLADVVLLDVAEGLPQGKALDMMHSRSVERFAPRVTGTSDYAETAGSDVVVITAGLSRKPGMTRDDLLAANSVVVRSVVESAVEASPEAVLLCVTNPLDVMTHLAQRSSGLPASRVLGMGGVLDSARFAYFIAEATAAPIDSVEALVVGAHGDAMVPLPAHSTAGGTPVTRLLPPEQVDELVRRTVHGGAEVVSLLGNGSAFYAPAASVVRMLGAILGDTGEVMTSCVRPDGPYGIDDVYVSVPAALGRGGVHGIPELPLTAEELAALRASAETVREAVAALPAGA